MWVVSSFDKVVIILFTKSISLIQFLQKLYNFVLELFFNLNYFCQQKVHLNFSNLNI
jgi:hypothetical protein